MPFGYWWGNQAAPEPLYNLQSPLADRIVGGFDIAFPDPSPGRRIRALASLVFAAAAGSIAERGTSQPFFSSEARLTYRQLYAHVLDDPEM